MTTELSCQFKSPSDPRQSFFLDIDTQFSSVGLTAIYGASGAGKTTLLRCIAGLNYLPQGECRLGDEVWQSGKYFVPAHRRPVGYVFQNASLFPHLSVKKNLAFAARRACGPTKIDRNDLLELLDIQNLLHRYPSGLSGGEQQRVAIARTLLVQPKLLLMDEPLSSVDEVRRQMILPYLEKLRDYLAIPIFYVTHAFEEVMRLADNIALLEKGQIISQGKFLDVMTQKSVDFSCNGGKVSVIEGRVVKKDRQWGLIEVAFPGGALRLVESNASLGQSVRLGIQANDVVLAVSFIEGTSALNQIRGKIIDMDGDGSCVWVKVSVGMFIVVARVTLLSASLLKLEEGLAVYLLIKSVALVRHGT